MRLRPANRRAAGFTLIEVIVSAALMALILVSAYTCLNAGLESQKVIEPRVEITQNARVAMAMLAADLREACPLSPDFNFLGMQRVLGDAPADNLDFATHHHTAKGAREADFCEVSYFVESDPKTHYLSLWRRRNPVIAYDPLTGGTREELVRGLQGVAYEYYDGLDWYATWGEINPAKAQNSQRPAPNLTGMPEAVRITLSFDGNPGKRKPAVGEQTTGNAPLIFQTVVRLELAAAARLAPAGGASGGGTNAAPDVSGGAVPFGGGN